MLKFDEDHRERRRKAAAAVIYTASVLATDLGTNRIPFPRLKDEAKSDALWMTDLDFTIGLNEHVAANHLIVKPDDPGFVTVNL